MTINKKAPTPFINMPYLDIGEDLEFEGGVATPHLNIMFRKVQKALETVTLTDLGPETERHFGKGPYMSEIQVENFKLALWEVTQ